jgi:hypothetical protein
MSKDTIQETQVIVAPNSLEMSPHGSLTGIITIRAGSACFPDEHWNDFPVVILSWWLKSVPQILSGKTHVWNCTSMDGPFSFHLEQQHEDTWTLLGLHDGRIKFTATVSCRVFILSLLDAAHQVLRECQERGWQSRDIEALDSAVRTVQREVS